MNSKLPAFLHVSKGHGTQNDFVLIDDRDGQLDLTDDLVRALADRRAGVGADGVIRLVGSAHLPPGRELLGENPQALWFMDYRNADGSIAQMCGNGVRVLARFAEHLGIWDGQEELPVATRAGVRMVRKVPAVSGADTNAADWYQVHMGKVHLSGETLTVNVPNRAPGSAPGAAAAVHAAGIAVNVGNPHVVVSVEDVSTLNGLDLHLPPAVAPEPAAGVNVELVVRQDDLLVGSQIFGRVQMRVHERGVGETRSCGTGACAAAVAVASVGEHNPGQWLVQVPGGTVQVTLLPDGSTLLAGPAVLVAHGTVEVKALG